MDTGLGDFAPISPTMADLLKQKSLSGKVFEEGETVRLKECMFRVSVIGKHDITLRLMPDDNYQQIPQANKD